MDEIAPNQGDGRAPGSGARRVWPEWYAMLATYRRADRRSAVWQIVNSIVPYLGLLCLMIWSVRDGWPYAVTLLLALPAAGFIMRMFILFHDCTHGSLFASKRANTVVGSVLGVLVFTSFANWRFSHIRHHASTANLEGRGFGDIRTLTVGEYRNLPGMQRLFYRLYRNPFVLLVIGPLFTFFYSNRKPARTVKWRERVDVLLTNLLIAVLALTVAWLVGWRTYLLVQLPVIWISGAMGIWLFYVQHQFSGGYWAHKTEWEPLRAALEGSSFYKLPAVLRWFSGNIGYHHIHHLHPGIPNYRLKQCHEDIPALQQVPTLTLRSSLSCVRLKLWDEDRKEMVAFPVNV
jgi:acyl-lipid omega-6 desaturase (Delta-12 desaturase)